MVTERGICWHESAEDRDKGVEHELLQLITAIVRAERPQTITETGAFPGTVSKALWAAMDADQFLASWEIVDHYAIEHKRITDEYRNWGTYQGSPKTFNTSDLTILDSSPYGLRDDEFWRWHSTARKGSLLIVHDVLDDRWIKPWANTWLGNPQMTFGTEWGIGLWRMGR